MKLSIFVVTYNQEQYIRQALDSILAQRVNFDYEIIIGEDCSTDSTHAICDEYAAGIHNTSNITHYTSHITHHPSIRVYHHNPNKGLIPNWAFVLNHCHGEYIAMLEGDDFWTNPDKLQTQVDYLDAHPEVVLTFTSADVLYEGGDCRDEHLFDHLQNRIYSFREIYEHWSILSSTVVFRNCPALPISYPKQIYINDTYTFMRILQYGSAYCFTDKWTTYRRHASNLSRVDTPEASLRWAIQHRYIGQCFPEVKDLAHRNESLYLEALIYDRTSRNTWRYRFRYMWLNKHLFFSRFALATFKYMFNRGIHNT